MITSPHTSVTPRQELARLTLMTSTAEAKIRRKSTLGGTSRPSLGEIDGRQVLGPITNPAATTEKLFDGVTVQSPTAVEAPQPQFDTMSLSVGSNPAHRDHGVQSAKDGDVDLVGDDSSEVTLVSSQSMEDSVMVDLAVKDQKPQTLENKENLAPSVNQTRSSELDEPDESGAALLRQSPSKLKTQAASTVVMDGLATSGPADQGESQVEPPTRPPPIPPRPPQSPTPMLEEYARQQDVTEVLNHVLFQLSCAIRPTGTDKDGEQIDQIQDLFYGKTTSHVVPEDSTPVLEKFSSIITRLALKPHDIYAALDGYFDMEEIEGGSKRFLSISRLPPIFQVHFDRVGFDSTTKTNRKINHHVDLKETIFLDRYLEDSGSSVLMERREQAWGWKKELAVVEARMAELAAAPVSCLSSML